MRSPVFAVARRLAPIVALTLVLNGCRETAASGAPPTPEGQPAPLVRVLEVTPERLEATVELAGAVDSRVVSRIMAPAEGVIESLRVREGDAVAKGQIVAFVSTSERLALLAMTESRVRGLRARGSGELSKEDRDELERMLRDAEADRRYAGDLVLPVPVVAPVSGRVLEKPVETGSMVASRELLMTIGDLTRPVVRTTVADLLLPRLRVGDPVRVRVHALPGEVFAGTLRVVGPQVDPATRTAPIEVEVRAPSGQLRPGMTATVEVVTDRREAALLVPDDAFVPGAGGQRLLFIASADTARQRAVDTGLSINGRTEVVAGLSAGDLVIVEGQRGLRDGTAVRHRERKP